jgi:hypothetical protein
MTDFPLSVQMFYPALPAQLILAHRRQADGPQNEVLQRGDEKRRITDSGHHPEDFDAEFLGVFSRLNIDFVECLDVFRNKRNRYHQHLFDTLGAKPLNRACQRRL